VSGDLYKRVFLAINRHTFETITASHFVEPADVLNCVTMAARLTLARIAISAAVDFVVSVLCCILVSSVAFYCVGLLPQAPQWPPPVPCTVLSFRRFHSRYTGVSDMPDGLPAAFDVDQMAINCDDEANYLRLQSDACSTSV
jgi:hypothetical protein